jgi:gamma-glutamylcyclotransferase (GGCT)/AIG2-like uncharacterized protein YtfP
MDLTHSLEDTLIIYGSLAPNAPNHRVVAHIKGQWLKGNVMGTLKNMGWGADFGYLGFKLADINQSKNIPVHVLISEELPNNWAYLDDFEGDGYKRIACPYQLANGDTGVGYIYAINS